MTIVKHHRTWLEIDGAWPPPPVRVGLTSVDLGDGKDRVPAIQIGTKPKQYFQQGGFPTAQPTVYLIRVEDLKELVRMVEESPEELPGPG